MNKFLVLSVAGLSAIATQASALTTTNSAVFPATLADFTSGTLTLQPFNTSLGTLNSATLVLTANGNISATVKNNTTTTQDFTISTNTRVSLSQSSPASSVFGLKVDLPATQNFTQLAPGATAVYGPYMISGTTGNVAGTPLSAFQSGPITFTATTVSSLTRLGGGSIDTAVTTTVSGTATVTYDYTPTPPPTTVPEPASMALLGLGLAGLGLIRRRSV